MVPPEHGLHLLLEAIGIDEEDSPSEPERAILVRLAQAMANPDFDGLMSGILWAVGDTEGTEDAYVYATGRQSKP
jgi:hypothetical protein